MKRIVLTGRAQEAFEQREALEYDLFHERFRLDLLQFRYVLHASFGLRPDEAKEVDALILQVGEARDANDRLLPLYLRFGREADSPVITASVCDPIDPNERRREVAGLADLGKFVDDVRTGELWA